MVRKGSPVRVRHWALLVIAALLAGCGGGDVETGDSSAHGAEITRYELPSRFVGRRLEQIAVRLEGAGDRPPLLVFLHGRGGTGAESNVKDEVLAALDEQGRRAPAVVFPDGGDHSYWHDRRDGRWEAYLVREVIPAAVRRLRADPRRVAIGGISMGGYGAFNVALHHPDRFCAVGGHSAAIWINGGESAPGAFDDAEDFARNDVIATARTRRPARRIWLDSGDRDPFVPGQRELARVLGVPKRTWRGGHDGDYWNAHYDEYMRFYARALAAC
jgi:poly(3-hydroxybutyrate) depolymerase